MSLIVHTPPQPHIINVRRLTLLIAKTQGGAFKTLVERVLGGKGMPFPYICSPFVLPLVILLAAFVLFDDLQVDVFQGAGNR